MHDIKHFHTMFYRKPQKDVQDHFIVKHTIMNKVKRRRAEKGTYSVKDATANYFIRTKAQSVVRVCRGAFLTVLGISARRVNTVLKKYYHNGNVNENRGGFQRKDEFENKKKCVIQFINTLKCVESHYCRGKSNRKYLSSELNITKLWKMYSGIEGNVPVKESYFRMIFNTNYNLGFGSPRSDMCSVCLQLRERISSAKDVTEQAALTTELRVHKARAKAFFELLQDEDPSKLIVSFDCEKNMPLPRLPDQAVYYSRQFYMFNFTIVRGNSKTTLAPENVTSYMWTENEFQKDSNTIASCVFDYLNSTDMTEYTTLRLVSDGCGGQNKNSIMVCMLMKWFGKYAPQNIKSVELVFPVTGHSYIPPDKVFGFIEKEIRKHEIIQTCEELKDLVSRYSTVKEVSSDTKIYNFKESMKGVVKKCTSWHFQISKMKRVFFKRSKTNKILVRGEPHFKTNVGTYKNLFKTSCNYNNIDLITIHKTNKVTQEKKKDVENLLKKHYGDEWRNIELLKFYKHVIDGSEEAEELNDTPCCQPQEEEQNVFV